MEQKNQPTLLKVLETIVASPEEIKKETNNLIKKIESKYSHVESQDCINKRIAKKIIEKYSYFCAYSGGLTSLTGIIPGLGTVSTIVGGASADIIICMKYQIEMTMALAYLYKHDIEKEENKRLCYLIAGLGAINKFSQSRGKEFVGGAFIKMVKNHLKGSTLVAVKKVFQKIGITFTRKSFVKTIPFGVGCVLGATVNKLMALYIGKKALDFFTA